MEICTKPLVGTWCAFDILLTRQQEVMEKTTVQPRVYVLASTAAHQKFAGKKTFFLEIEQWRHDC